MRRFEHLLAGWQSGRADAAGQMRRYGWVELELTRFCCHLDLPPVS